MGSEAEIARAKRDLKSSIKKFGYESEQAKQGAIRLCNLYGVSPFIRYPTRTKPAGPNVPKGSALEYEWQRLIARIAASKV
jgi:hypothetical protein